MSTRKKYILKRVKLVATKSLKLMMLLFVETGIGGGHSQMFSPDVYLNTFYFIG